VAPGFVIAIDGPAASGKSSTAQQVAERLGFRHADSGALYRAVTAARLARGGEPAGWTEDSVLDAARAVSLVPGSTRFGVLLDGKQAGDQLHGAAVTAQVSLVARMPRVREWVNARMRDCARSGPLVVDGRDMGTAVFPAAQLKVFLVADAHERARRRLTQRLGRPGTAAEIETEAAELTKRDQRDAVQTQQAPDAVVIDTTRLTQEEQVRRIVELVRPA
jgi:cytidylate kinase